MGPDTKRLKRWVNKFQKKEKRKLGGRVAGGGGKLSVWSNSKPPGVNGSFLTDLGGLIFKPREMMSGWRVERLKC